VLPFSFAPFSSLILSAALKMKIRFPNVLLIFEKIFIGRGRARRMPDARFDYTVMRTGHLFD
jgi:hypothetical protein